MKRVRELTQDLPIPKLTFTRWGSETSGRIFRNLFYIFWGGKRYLFGIKNLIDSLGLCLYSRREKFLSESLSDLICFFFAPLINYYNYWQNKKVVRIDFHRSWSIANQFD